MDYSNEKIKYFLYARKSSESEDRQMASIDSQIEELEKLAKNNNLEIVRVFSEAKSAKEPGRAVFADMLLRIKKGEANGILCWKLNRLARNPVDGGEISWLLQQGTIQSIFTYGRNYRPTDNVIVMAVELGMATKFVRDLSIDSKRGLLSKAERGWYPAYSTLGYMHNPYKQKGEKEIIKDPERFDLVRRMFDLLLTGTTTVPRIHEIATKEWGLTSKKGGRVAKSTVYRIFTDPFYYGEFEYPKGSGNWYKGKHESMITKAEYILAQKIISGKNKPRPQTHCFAFTGLIRCGECGCAITAEDKVKRQKNGNIHYYTYYHCTKRKDLPCNQKTIRLEALEEQIAQVLETFEIPEEFKEWALDILQKENVTAFESQRVIQKNNQKEYEDCITKIDALIDMRASKEITLEEFQTKKQKLIKEKDSLLRLLNSSDENIDNWIEKAEQIFTFAEIARYKFISGTIDDKRAVLASIGSNLLLKDRKLLNTLPKSLVAMQQMKALENKLRKRLEPLKNPLDKRKLVALYDQDPMMLRR